MINIDLNSMPIDITLHIRKFRLFLITLWPHLDQLMEFHDWNNDIDFMDDWLDANWQILVEREILGNEGVLSPLSVPLSDNFVNNSKKKFTVKVKLSEFAKTTHAEWGFSTNESLRFFGFCTNLDRGGVGIYPPFDFASLVQEPEKKIFHVPFFALKFYLVNFSEI